MNTLLCGNRPHLAIAVMQSSSNMKLMIISRHFGGIVACSTFAYVCMVYEKMCGEFVG